MHMVAKRFIRNRMAVTGLVILVFMFVFSFIGGLISPYGQDQFFIINPRDDEAFRRIVNYPARGIGDSKLYPAAQC